VLISRARLGPITDAAHDALEDLQANHARKRLHDGDHTLWQDDPTEVADRLGWLVVGEEMGYRTVELGEFAQHVVDAGIDHAVLLGMGGSSLFPEVLNRTFGAASSGLPLTVLDTTDPAAIGRIHPERTVFVVASKSGTTIETRTQLDHFWERTGSNGAQFVVVTDPDSELAHLGHARGMRAVFENRPDIGGR
jgi:glucose-6-phosphate isomerase/transaldolase/glucose-6-phosphate isomerase